MLVKRLPGGVFLSEADLHAHALGNVQTDARRIVRQVRPARQPIHGVRRPPIHKSVTELAELLCGPLQPARLRNWVRTSQRIAYRSIARLENVATNPPGELALEPIEMAI
jgi:hypothetical protein